MNRLHDSNILPRNTTDLQRASEEFRRAMLRQLEGDAETLLNGFKQKFQEDISKTLTETLRLLQSSAGGDSSGVFPLPSLGGITRILGSVLGRTRARTSSVMRESGRSQEAFAQFRLSQSQSLAEANDALTLGDKTL